MDIYSQFSDPHPLGTPNSFSSSLSESGIAISPPQLSHSDEEVTCHSLATNQPKKRAGRRVFRETRHPVYRGVRKRNGNKWVCEMREPNNKKTRIWLGTYPTPEMAARAHDVAALAFRGKSACLNFADSAWRLPVPSSLDAKEIRRVANEAAHMFGPNVDAPIEASSDGNIINVNNNNSNNVFYVDDEAVLDMPRLLEDMAQGLLLSPPNYLDDGLYNWESDADFSLWSY